MGTLPDWVAAVAAIIAATLVGWQSWETRKSAQASARAAVAANSAVELSRSAVEIARAEEGHTRRLINEAVKTRVDYATPTLTVVTGNLVGPLEKSSRTDYPADELDFVGKDQVYRLPKDQDRLVSLRQFFTLISDAPKIMVLDMPQWIPYEDEERNPDWRPRSNVGQHRLGINTQQEGYFLIERSIKDWVAIAEAGHSADTSPPFDFIIGYVDPADTGAIDSYVIRVCGSPLVRIPDEMGAWGVSDPVFPPGTSTIMARSRRYYLSRLDNQPLE